MSDTPTVSVVLATHNRRDVTLATLLRLYCLREDVPFEIIVVDNQSADGTANAVRQRFPDVRLIALKENRGSCAKAYGVDQAAGKYVLFLDDDSYPRPTCLTRMVHHFEADPQLGVAGFHVHLPDGGEECSAFPEVYIGCGAGFRRDALNQVGGLDRDLFMAAEEYDLSFRLINAGWKIKTFADLHIDHLKSPQARGSARLAYHDTYNNLLVAARYLPDEFLPVVFRDWAERYNWYYADDELRAEHHRAKRDGRRHRKTDRQQYENRRLSNQAFEQLFHFHEIETRMQQVADQGIQKIILADLGKNIYAFWRAARLANLEIICIADDRFAAPQRTYRGTPVLQKSKTPWDVAQAIIVSNTSPVHARLTEQPLADRSSTPVYRWFGFDPARIDGISNPPFETACITG
jgi:GT2 family glycosyltransferase